MKPQIGQPAPDFTAPVTGGDYPEGSSITLSALRGQRVVLVFYPKDDTPGCTTQACALRDGWEEIRGQARVFGVSIDPVKSHNKFIAKYSLPYPLIADPDQQIVADYGVWVEKSMYGKTFMGTERSTFIIAPDGSIESILEKVAPAKHLELLAEALAGK
jgi:peroxiredoxin Q/BCP